MARLIHADPRASWIDEAISTSWIRREVEGLYSETMGRTSIDPESALRLMKRSLKGLIAIINSFANIEWLVSNNRFIGVTS